MGYILKEKPKLLYVYKVLKSNSLYPAHNVNDLIETEYDAMDEKYYKKVGTWTRAHIEDYQKFIDRIRTLREGEGIDDVSIEQLLDEE